MKNLLALSIVALFTAISCDVIDDPIIDRGVTGGGGNDTNTVVKRAILLEEFTGVKCNNCPRAAEEAKRLEAIYGDQLIIVGIHAGNLAQTDADHPKAFRTPEGTAYFNDFQLFGVPVGFVNRDGDSDAEKLKLYQDWDTEIGLQVDDVPLAKIGLSEESYNTTTRELSVEGNIEVLEDLPTSAMNVVVILTENKIISAQTMPDKSIDPNYEHNHVFRGTFNSAYGEAIDLSTGSATFSANLTLDQEMVKENCEAIAYLYNLDTQEILQATKIEL